MYYYLLDNLGYIDDIIVSDKEINVSDYNIKNKFSTRLYRINYIQYKIIPKNVLDKKHLTKDYIKNDYWVYIVLVALVIIATISILILFNMFSEIEIDNGLYIRTYR